MGPCKVIVVSNTECKFENLDDLGQTVTVNVSNYIIHLVLVPYSGLFPWGANFHYFCG